MGSTRPEREDAQARTAYIAAARRFAAAMGAFTTAGVPVAPRSSSRELPAWERYDVAVMLELQAALGESPRGVRMTPVAAFNTRGSPAPTERGDLLVLLVRRRGGA